MYQRHTFHRAHYVLSPLSAGIAALTSLLVLVGGSRAFAQSSPPPTTMTRQTLTSDGANLMVVRNDRFEIKRIKQLLLILAAPPHHRRPHRCPNLA